jgi:cytochrome P450
MDRNIPACPAPDLGSVTSAEARACPIPFFKRLLAQAPVYRDPVTGSFIVTRYDDIAFVADNPATFASFNNITIGRQSAEVQRRFRERGFPEVHTLVTADAPGHTRYRRLVDKVFTPTSVKALEPKVYQVTDELLDQFAGRGSAELFSEFASLMPLYVIADQLGLPRSDSDGFRRWSEAVVERADPTLAADRELELTDEFIDMQNYLHGYFEKYRREPNGSLLSNLAHVEHEGDRLTSAELVSIGFQLLVGGNETSATAIMSTTNELLADAALLQRVRADLAVIPTVVEEVLRLHPPAPAFYRTVMQDTVIGGVPVPKGSSILLSYMGGNYDPRKFSDPDRLDVARKGLRQHLTFGRGLHFCVGHILAKTEIRVAVERLVTRLPNLRLSRRHPGPVYISHAFVHMLDALHVEFDPG